MRRDIEQRLEKLERRIPRAPTEQEKAQRRFEHLKVHAIAFYLGEPTPEGSVIEAFQRALGYPNGYEFKKALEAKDPDFFKRANSALEKLWAKFGVKLEDVIREGKWDAVEDALRRMEAGLPDDHKECLKHP